MKLVPVTIEIYSQRDPGTTVPCLTVPNQKRTPMPGPYWAMDKPKGGNKSIKLSGVVTDLNVLFPLSVMLFWLLQLLSQAFRGKGHSFLGIYFANAIRENGREENILEMSKAIYLDIFLR